MMVEFGGNATVYRLLPLKKIHKIAKPLCYFVVFEERRKKKKKIRFRDISCFFFNQFTQNEGQKNPIYFYRGPWLEVK